MLTIKHVLDANRYYFLSQLINLLSRSMNGKGAFLKLFLGTVLALILYDVIKKNG